MSDRREKLRDLTNRMNNETDETTRRILQHQIQEVGREIRQREREAREYERALQTSFIIRNHQKILRLTFDFKKARNNM